jgi:hypothetical protein
MLQERLLSSLDPGNRAGVDESKVSVVNLSVSEPLAGVIAEELEAGNPLGRNTGFEVVLQGSIGVSHQVCIHPIQHCDGLHEFGGATLAQDGQEQGLHDERTVCGRLSARHCWLVTGLD